MTEPVTLIVDPDSATPPFEQLKQQIAQARSDGRYAPGDRLPPVRSLATAVGLAANTVARAYRELEEAGVIETRGRAGSFITASADTAPKAARAAARRYLDEVLALGLGPDDATAALRDVTG